MKRSKSSDSQIVDAVKRVEAGIGVPDICRELGISSATFYKWRAKYGGVGDLLPINRTSYFSKKSIYSENDGHENKQIQRRANHWFFEAGRSGHADQGNRAQARFQ